MTDLAAKARELQIDPTGYLSSGPFGFARLAAEIARKQGILANGGTDTKLPAVAPPPTPGPSMGLRLPRKDAVGVSSLKLTRR